MHGYQIWVALPTEKEEMEPRFDYIKCEDLPSWKQEGLNIRVVAGEAFGKKSPLPVHSPLFMVDITAEEVTALEIKGQVKGEIAFVVVNGKVIDEGQEIGAGQMLISKSDNECSIRVEKGTRLIMFGGEPFEEERFLYWNFVSSSKERLEQAKEDWISRRFPKIPEDDTYIPLPG